MYFELKQEIYESLKQVCMDIRRQGEILSVQETVMRLMDIQKLPMYSPYHHFIIPAALLTLAAIGANHKEEQLSDWMEIAEDRAKTVPAGLCGECGACGAAVGIGIFISAFTGATPKSIESWQWANKATGICLQRIAAYPGPRCCKRASFLALDAGVPYINDVCGLDLKLDEKIECKYHTASPDCLKSKCPFYTD